MKNKERIAILEAEISRLKVANRNNTYRIEAIESHLAEQHKGANFSKANSSEIPNTCEPIKPDFIPDWKDAPEDAVCVAMDGNGDWFWYNRKTSGVYGFVFIGAPIKIAGKATNADLLPPDYWKSTLMMRPDANAGDWATAPDWATHKAMDKSGEWNWYSDKPYKYMDNSEWIHKTGKYKLIPNHPSSDKDWTETLEMRPDALSAPDYTHLLPEGYEFCQEEDAEKWVKVEYEAGWPLGIVIDITDKVKMDAIMHNHIKQSYRPIRPIQYKVTTHEIVTAVPDPYQPDWSKAPEGTVAHVYDQNRFGRFYYVNIDGVLIIYGYRDSYHLLPPDLDWKQSLRVKPN
jgi:hypothetical protein